MDTSAADEEKRRYYIPVLYHEANKGCNNIPVVFHKGGKGRDCGRKRGIDVRKTVREKKTLMFGQDRNFVRA